jgi:hypothetical protein
VGHTAIPILTQITISHSVLFRKGPSLGIIASPTRQILPFRVLCYETSINGHCRLATQCTLITYSVGGWLGRQTNQVIIVVDSTCSKIPIAPGRHGVLICLSHHRSNSQDTLQSIQLYRALASAAQLLVQTLRTKQVTPVPGLHTMFQSPIPNSQPLQSGITRKNLLALKFHNPRCRSARSPRTPLFLSLGIKHGYT